MFCPVCRDEYRPGIDTCVTCKVPLVASLEDGRGPKRADEPPAPLVTRDAEPTVNYCGFLTLEDARGAKSTLREHGASAEILIRDGEDGHEEFWLRVRPRDVKLAQEVLGFDEHEPAEDESFMCSACHGMVPGDADRCPTCGARFEEA